MIRNALLLFVALTMVVPSAQAIAPPDRVYEVDVTLVSCAVCRKQMKGIFMAIENVKAVDFDLQAKKAIVTMNGDKVLSRAKVEEAFKLSKYCINGMVERKAPESKPTGSPKGS